MDFFKRFKKRIYLDYAAATPLHPMVAALVRKYERDNFANPSAIHQEGQRARKAVEEARLKVATALKVQGNGVVFTGSGTEANNLAILGYVKNLARTENKAYRDMEVVTTKLEHPSVLEVMKVLEATGVVVKYVEVDEFGEIKPGSLNAVLSDKTVLVSFAYANSEIGIVQPVLRLTRIVREFEKKHNTKILIHLDAAQAPLWLSCEPARLGIDIMTLDAGKCYGPKGVGVLVMHTKVSLLPIMYGGGQEQGLRPGTEAVGAIAGAAEAIRLAQTDFNKRAEKVAKIRDEAISLILSGVPGSVLNGGVGDSRLANNINISLPGFDTEYAVVYLDAHDIAASTKSACAGTGGGESKVVKEISGDSSRATSTIRFTIGEDTTLKDFKKVVAALNRFCIKMSALTK